MKKAAVWVFAAVALAGAVILVCIKSRLPSAWDDSRRQLPQEDLERAFVQMEPRDKELGEGFNGMDKPIPWSGAAKAKKRPAKASGQTDAEAGDDVPAAEPTEEEKAEAKADEEVEAFDALTDKWMEAKEGKAPTMEDIDAFVEQFRKIPADRKDECIHRALNLIPDENVMLLAGVLMDKGQDAETVDAVFSDILNRDESVKLPVLREVIKDTKHPCWKDAAWILDVTKQEPTGNAAAAGEEKE